AGTALDGCVSRHALSTDGKVGDRAFASLVRGLSRCGIDDGANHGTFRTGVDQRAQDAGRVAGSSATRVVLGIGDRDRLRRDPGFFESPRDGVRSRIELGEKIALPTADLRRELV